MSLTATDLFCGAGGSSLGFESAGGTLRLGLNHWDRAIETHGANFPHADHDCEDIASLTTAQIRRYPDSDILMASPECTNHSLAKGAQRKKPQAGSLFEDGPAGDEEQERSRATMWDVVRFAEQKMIKGRPYKAVIVENVVDAFKWGYGDNGGLFAAWRQAMSALGYLHEIVWLNSMFVPPTPQSRDRMYVVFWLKEIRHPDLALEPVGWCPSCEKIVHGRQTWKRLDKPAWGRYGPQYFYSCPECRGAIAPGAAPAQDAIDWTLPIQKIGDRDRPLAEATRQRIRRGLERLAAEPFCIRLTHGGAPKPATLPLVTLTGRHDLAMVTPVAGNTYERTPGNRARSADRQPLDTVHATLDRAMIVPPMGSVDPRDGLLAGPTQTTTTRAAVVQCQRNGILTPMEGHVHTIRAGGQHHAIVMRNNKTPSGNDAGMSTPVREPVRTVTTAGHQSLVVPYNRTGQAKLAEVEPTGTVTSHDRLSLVLTEDDIDACGFRMFALHEIALAMAMDQHTDGSEYEVIGNKRERMAQYGNAVTPPVMAFLVGRLLPVL